MAEQQGVTFSLRDPGRIQIYKNGAYAEQGPAVSKYAFMRLTYMPTPMNSGHSHSAPFALASSISSTSSSSISLSGSSPDTSAFSASILCMRSVNATSSDSETTEGLLSAKLSAKIYLHLDS